MIKSYLIPGIFIIFILISCKKNENNNDPTDIEYIKYGTSFGECIGYCKNDITIRDSEIDFHKSGWDKTDSLPEFSDKESLDTKHWTELINKINIDSFFKLDSVIGCPDCADGGAEWIEIKSKGKTHKIIFEFHNEPKETKEYIGYLRTYLSTFQIRPLTQPQIKYPLCF